MLEQFSQQRSPSQAAATAIAAGRACARHAAHKRAEARQRIHARVLHPIDVPRSVRDPLVRREPSLTGAFAGMRWVVVAAAVHVLATVLLVTGSRMLPDRPKPEAAKPLKVRIVDAPAMPKPIEVEPPKPEQSKPEPPKPTPKPKPKRKPKPKPKPTKKAASKIPPLPKVQEADMPPPDAEQAPAGSAAPIPLMGLSMESTISGAGPAFVPGNSRMGKAPPTAQPSGVSSNGPVASGSGTAKASPGLRAAARIPTRDVKLVKPKRLAFKQPAYPPTLRAQGIEGDVLVRVNLDPQGVVKAASVLRSGGHPAFDAAALAAARNERFSPALRDGKPIAYTLSYSYRFRIED